MEVRSISPVADEPEDIPEEYAEDFESDDEIQAPVQNSRGREPGMDDDDLPSTTVRSPSPSTVTFTGQAHTPHRPVGPPGRRPPSHGLHKEENHLGDGGKTAVANPTFPDAPFPGPADSETEATSIDRNRVRGGASVPVVSLQENTMVHLDSSKSEPRLPMGSKAADAPPNSAASPSAEGASGAAVPVRTVGLPSTGDSSPVASVPVSGSDPQRGAGATLVNESGTAEERHTTTPIPTTVRLKSDPIALSDAGIVVAPEMTRLKEGSPDVAHQSEPHVSMPVALAGDSVAASIGKDAVTATAPESHNEPRGGRADSTLAVSKVPEGKGPVGDGESQTLQAPHGEEMINMDDIPIIDGSDVAAPASRAMVAIPPAAVTPGSGARANHGEEIVNAPAESPAQSLTKPSVTGTSHGRTTAVATSPVASPFASPRAGRELMGVSRSTSRDGLHQSASAVNPTSAHVEEMRKATTEVNRLRAMLREERDDRKRNEAELSKQVQHLRTEIDMLRARSLSPRKREPSASPRSKASPRLSTHSHRPVSSQQSSNRSPRRPRSAHAHTTTSNQLSLTRTHPSRHRRGSADEAGVPTFEEWKEAKRRAQINAHRDARDRQQRQEVIKLRETEERDIRILGKSGAFMPKWLMRDVVDRLAGSPLLDAEGQRNTSMVDLNQILYSLDDERIW